MPTLRFIDSQFFSGAMNMAVDETLAGSLSQKTATPYIRFYQWKPATISFGYNQKIERIIDIEAAQTAGFALVRRMSGGKMVFHNDEYTFSTGLTAEFIESRIGRGKTFLEMFQLVISPLIEGLKQMGVPARFASSREEMRHSSNSLHCYATAAGHSIYAGKRKLVGAAGVFRENCLIVHGSIPVKASFPPDHLFISNHKISHDIEMAALSDYCNISRINQLPAIVARKYSEQLGLAIIEQALSQDEISAAEALASNKYQNLHWHSKI